MILLRILVVGVTGVMVVGLGYLPIAVFKYLYALVAPTNEFTRIATLLVFWMFGGGITITLWILLFAVFSMVTAAMVVVDGR